MVSWTFFFIRFLLYFVLLSLHFVYSIKFWILKLESKYLLKKLLVYLIGAIRAICKELYSTIVEGLVETSRFVNSLCFTRGWSAVSLTLIYFHFHINFVLWLLKITQFLCSCFTEIYSFYFCFLTRFNFWTLNLAKSWKFLIKWL